MRSDTTVLNAKLDSTGGVVMLCYGTSDVVANCRQSAVLYLKKKLQLDVSDFFPYVVQFLPHLQRVVLHVVSPFVHCPT